MIFYIKTFIYPKNINPHNYLIEKGNTKNMVVPKFAVFDEFKLKNLRSYSLLDFLNKIFCIW